MTLVKASCLPACDVDVVNDATVQVDARGLEPPQPMVVILEALGSLPSGVELHAHTDRRPMHLYPLLEQRGFSATTEPQADGSFLTTIRRNPAMP